MQFIDFAIDQFMPPCLPPTSAGFSVDDWKSLADIISSGITSLAVIAGGVWAYFKFFRGRTFKPRLGVEVAAQWRVSDDRDLLHVRIVVTNLGASRIWLNQYGSGMRVSFPDTSGVRFNEVGWTAVPLVEPDSESAPLVDPPPARVFEIFTAHEWIEPAESVSDDLLLDLDRGRTMTKLDVALLWNTRKRQSGFSHKDIQVDACRIIPIDSTLINALDTKS